MILRLPKRASIACHETRVTRERSVPARTEARSYTLLVGCPPEKRRETPVAHPKLTLLTWRAPRAPGAPKFRYREMGAQRPVTAAAERGETHHLGPRRRARLQVSFVLRTRRLSTGPKTGASMIVRFTRHRSILQPLGRCAFIALLAGALALACGGNPSTGGEGSGGNSGNQGNGGNAGQGAGGEGSGGKIQDRSCPPSMAVLVLRIRSAATANSNSASCATTATPATVTVAPRTAAIRIPISIAPRPGSSV